MDVEDKKENLKKNRQERRLRKRKAEEYEINHWRMKAGKRAKSGVEQFDHLADTERISPRRWPNSEVFNNNSSGSSNLRKD